MYSVGQDAAAGLPKTDGRRTSTSRRTDQDGNEEFHEEEVRSASDHGIVVCYAKSVNFQQSCQVSIAPCQKHRGDAGYITHFFCSLKHPANLNSDLHCTF